MLSRRQSPRPQRARRGLAALVLALPLLASGCISVKGDAQLGATMTPKPTLPAAAGSPTTPPLASPTPVPTPEPTPEPVAAEVLGFVPGWLLGQASATIDTELLTIAAIHSIEASGDGKLVSKKPSGDVPPGWEAMASDAFAELKAQLQADGVRVVPVIGRMGWTEGTARRTENLLSRRKNRRDLAGRIARFVADRGFDGVNLDFEPVPAKLAGEYVSLVRDVRAALDEVDPGLHLSVDVLPGLDGYDLAALVAPDAADMAVIMGYNYRTGAAGVAGSTAPLRDASGSDLAGSVAAALAQLDPGQVVLALPWYGKEWATQSGQAGSATLRGGDVDPPSDPYYVAAVETATQHGRNYDPDQASAWSAWAERPCPECEPAWRQVWYDDPESFGAKVDYAIEQGLAGVGIWAMGMDGGRDDLWNALRYRLRPVNDRTAPGGSASLDPEEVRDQLDGRNVVQDVAPLRLFGSDEAGGSGVVLVRIGLDAEVDGDGRLVTARTYPADEATDVRFPLGDPATGGAPEPGPRDIHVQWRDLAGNWSQPLVIEAWALAPSATLALADP